MLPRQERGEGFLDQRRRRWWSLLGAIALLVFAITGSASAQGFSVSITVDENGNSRFTTTAGFDSAMPFSLLTDPGPTGLANALTYSLFSPPGLVAGDVVLLEPGTQVVSDLLRFNASQSCSGSLGCLVFYSDNTDGSDALADIGFPTGRYTNLVTFTEVGLEGDNGFVYTPTAGQPGFVAGAPGP
jgi:hypothetical protein